MNLKIYGFIWLLYLTCVIKSETGTEKDVEESLSLLKKLLLKVRQNPGPVGSQNKLQLDSVKVTGEVENEDESLDEKGLTENDTLEGMEDSFTDDEKAIDSDVEKSVGEDENVDQERDEKEMQEKETHDGNEYAKLLTQAIKEDDDAEDLVKSLLSRALSVEEIAQEMEKSDLVGKSINGQEGNDVQSEAARILTKAIKEDANGVDIVKDLLSKAMANNEKSVAEEPGSENIDAQVEKALEEDTVNEEFEQDLQEKGSMEEEPYWGDSITDVEKAIDADDSLRVEANVETQLNEKALQDKNQDVDLDPDVVTLLTKAIKEDVNGEELVRSLLNKAYTEEKIAEDMDVDNPAEKSLSAEKQTELDANSEAAKILTKSIKEDDYAEDIVKDLLEKAMANEERMKDPFLKSSNKEKETQKVGPEVVRSNLLTKAISPERAEKLAKVIARLTEVLNKKKDMMSNRYRLWLTTLIVRLKLMVGQIKGKNPCNEFNSLMLRCPSRPKRPITCIDIVQIGDKVRNCGKRKNGGYYGFEEWRKFKTLMCNYVGGVICDKGCIPPPLMCDGEDQCSDGKDENPDTCKQRQEHCTKHGYFLCPQSSDKTPVCLAREALCNGNIDCPGGEDENNCQGGSSSNSGTSTNSGTNTNSGANTNSGTNTNAGANTNSGTNTNSAENTNTNSGTDTNSGTNSNTGSNTNSGTSSSTASNAPATCNNNICLLNSAMGSTIEHNCLYSHNKARKRHDVVDFTWNAQLETSSRNHAEKLAKENSFQHSSGNYGENLYYFSSSADRPKSCADAVYAWYREVIYPNVRPEVYTPYNYDQQGNQQPGTGHFTQVVWKKSTSVGCGIAKKTVGTSFTYLVVCQYSPPGNYLGQYTENVPKPDDPYDIKSADYFKPPQQ